MENVKSFKGTEDWYVIYTKPHFEKKVYEALKGSEIKSFLPTQKVRRQWSDRKKWVEMPLFPSYVFVAPTAQQEIKVLEIQGVVRYIIFNGRKAIVGQDEINLLQRIYKEGVAVQVFPDSFENEKIVRIINGPFQGFSGRLLRKYDGRKIAVRIEEIGYSVIFDISSKEIDVYN